MVEIHAGHSYLISQFLSPTMNDRTDEFGGCAENRARFCRMVIDEVRAAVGPRVPISLRLSVDELVEGGNTVEDCLEYLEFLNDGVDMFDTSSALNPSIQYQIDANYLEDGWRSYMAKAVRDKFHKPTIAIGNIRNPQVAEDILASGRRRPDRYGPRTDRRPRLVQQGKIRHMWRTSANVSPATSAAWATVSEATSLCAAP